jgi:hypothetical protein
MTFTLDQMAYEALLGNPNITEEVIDTLLSSSPNKWILEATADSEKANEAQLELVYKKSKSYDVLYNLARNPKTPVHIVETLFKEYKDQVCENTQIPNHLISKITQVKKLSKKAQEDFDRSCFSLARNPALSDKKDQLILAKKMSKPENLFLNPNLHGEVFEYLWASGVTQWASSFTDSKNFSEKHAIIMLTSDDEMIRAAVVRSQHGPKDVVLKARKDSSGRVREAAFKNPLFSINYADLDYTDLSAILGVVRRDDVPEEVLIKIAELEFPSHSDIKFVLARKNVPLSVLEILFSQGEVAPSNPNLSEEMLEHCITKGSDWDRRFALGNPKISLAKIKGYLGLEEKQSDVPKAKPFYELPDWYRHLVNAFWQLNYKEEVWTESPVPRIFIPELTDAIGPKDEIIGVIGGYFYKSDLGDQRIEEGYAQPIVQIDLGMLSKKTDINFGDKILQVWGDEDDWGQGGSALCEEVDREQVIERPDTCCIDVQLPEHLKNANQYDQAVACFDWSDSFYANNLGLRAPFFITGLDDAGLNVRLVNIQQREILSKKIAELNLSKKKIEEYYERNSPQEFTNEINALSNVQEFRLQTSFGNFNEENLVEFLEEFDDDFDHDEYEDEEVILGSGEWIPLMTLCGPLDDVIEDFYSIFYSRTMDGEFRYKAMAHRWCY